MTINCIAIDDEPIALQQIESYIKKTSFLNLVGTFKSAFEAIGVISESCVDLIFVDIQMPDLSGINFVKSLNSKQMIIFTTAFEQYAVDGFKVNAVDYLLKPFGYDEFLKSAQKALSLFNLSKGINTNNTQEYLFVRSGYKLHKVVLNDILYIESQMEYSKIVTHNQEPIIALLALKKIEEKLTSPSFVKVHRSYIVNVNYINEIDNGKIFIGNAIIPISKHYKKNIQDFLNKYNI